jgi:hypothetical protein
MVWYIWTGPGEQDSQNMTGRTGQLEQDNPDRIFIRGQP